MVALSSNNSYPKNTAEALFISLTIGGDARSPAWPPFRVKEM
jgi:hypothetical protein